MKKQRRDFLKAAGAVSAGGLLAPAVTLAQEEEKSPEDQITVGTLAEAEKLTGVPYTESERELVIKTIGQQIDLAKQVRELEMKNDDPAPALGFDPRLHETVIPREKWRVRRGRAKPLPDAEEDIAFAPVKDLSEWIRRKKLTSRRLTEIYLRRIDKYAGRLECVVTVPRDLALAQADEADKAIAAGNYRGPLHGIPYGAKDLLDTKGIRTTWGAMPYKDRVADRDATVVERLREAGAVLIAKTTLGALAYGDLWFDGVTRNPWNTEEGSGGSSAGSGSAVAAGLMGFAIGTETLGSIENPSSKNGVAGLRPTYGRVSRHGAMVLCWSLDKIGPMCRSVEDTMLVLKELNAYDPRDVGSIEAPLNYDNRASVRGMRIGYMKEWFEKETTPEAARTMLGKVEDQGMELVEIEFPKLPYQAMVPILSVEAGAALEELTLSNRDDLLRGQTPIAWPNNIRKARFVPAIDIIQADRLRRRAMGIMHETFNEVDAIMGPSVPTPGGGTIMTVLTNFTGNPAITLKVGFTESAARRSGLVDPKYFGAPASGIKKKVPACMTLWGPLFEEGRICQIAAALEEEAGLEGIRPELES